MKDCLARLKCDLRHLPIGSYRGHLCYWPSRHCWTYTKIVVIGAKRTMTEIYKYAPRHLRCRAAST
jgi:hypothetical protein